MAEDDIFREEGVSGMSTPIENRPALWPCLLRIESKDLDAVIFFAPDRFSRKAGQRLYWEDRVEKWGGRVRFATGEDEDSASGRLLRSVKAGVAEYEAEMIRERTLRGRRKLVEDGKIVGTARPPLGYFFNRELRTFEIDEDKAKIVRAVFDWCVVEGLGTDKIARRLQLMGIKPNQGGRIWTTSSVLVVLTQPAYMGRYPVMRGGGTRSVRPLDVPEGIAMIDVPPIVSPETFYAAQERRALARKNPVRSSVNAPLQGLLHCADDGLVFLSHYNHGDKNRRVYFCNGRLGRHHIDGSPRCRAPRLRAQWIEEQLLQRLTEAFSTPEAQERSVRDYLATLDARKRTLEVELVPVLDRFEGLKQQLSRLTTLFVEGDLSDAEYRARHGKIEAEAARLRERSASQQGELLKLEAIETNREFIEQALADGSVLTALRQIGEKLLVESRTATTGARSSRSAMIAVALLRGIRT